MLRGAFGGDGAEVGADDAAASADGVAGEAISLGGEELEAGVDVAGDGGLVGGVRVCVSACGGAGCGF